MLQYRLMLLIHLRKQKMHLREIEIQAMCSITEQNKAGLISLLDSYQDMLFPGVKRERTQKENFEEQAKKALAEEAKKVYVIKKRGDNREEYLKRMADSDNPDMKALAAKEMREHARQDMRRVTRLQQMRRMGKLKGKKYTDDKR